MSRAQVERRWLWYVGAVVLAVDIGLYVDLRSSLWRGGEHSRWTQPTAAEANAGQRSRPQPTRSATTRPTPDVERVEPTSEGNVPLPAALELVAGLNAPDHAPQEDLETLQSLWALYSRTAKGSGPAPTIGLNAELVDAWRGKNPARAALLPASTPAVNAQGELVDRWGTPYFIHPISAHAVDFRSAGPDCRLWTADDVFSSTGASEEAAQLTAGRPSNAE